jgi:1-acyl-sn-glycerol-3-phosphate acyltransferase
MKILTFIRSVISTILFPFTVLILGPIAIIGNFLTGSKRLDYIITVAWGRVVCFISGIRIVVNGKENIPEEGCLFLFNHASFFDIFAMADCIWGVKFGAKAELFKIPLFGRVISMMRMLPIARENREEVFKIYEEAKKRFAAGEKFALSPEGGRFYNPEHLSPFKAGPFIFAMSAGAPIVPVVLTGAYEALPKGTFLFNNYKFFHTITVNILEPIQTKNYTTDQRRELQKIVYDRMDAVWNGRKRDA